MTFQNGNYQEDEWELSRGWIISNEFTVRLDSIQAFRWVVISHWVELLHLYSYGAEFVLRVSWENDDKPIREALKPLTDLIMKVPEKREVV